MYIRQAVVLLASIAAITCNDLNVGRSSGKKIFDQTIQASPAIWRQSQKVEIKADNYEAISGIVVTDQREYKDGEVQIVEGGEGQNNVAIQLMSPAVFRGFDFHVVVYAEPTIVHPGILVKDIVNGSTPGSEDVTDVEDFSTPVPYGNTSEPSALANGTRLYRDTPVDPIVKYIGDKTTEMPAQDSDVTFGAKAVTTDSPASTPAVPAIETDNKNVTQIVKEVTKSDQGKIDDVLSTTASDQSTTTSDLSTTASDLSTTASDLSTTASGLSTTVGTGKIAVTEPTSVPEMMRDFDGISKELGQKVVFGFKH